MSHVTCERAIAGSVDRSAPTPLNVRRSCTCNAAERLSRKLQDWQQDGCKKEPAHAKTLCAPFGTWCGGPRSSSEGQCELQAWRLKHSLLTSRRNGQQSARRANRSAPRARTIRDLEQAPHRSIFAASRSIDWSSFEPVNDTSNSSVSEHCMGATHRVRHDSYCTCYHLLVSAR